MWSGASHFGCGKPSMSAARIAVSRFTQCSKKMIAPSMRRRFSGVSSGSAKKAVEIVEAFEQNAEHPHEPVEREKDGQQCSPQLLHGQQYDPGAGRCGIREALSPIFAG